MKFRLLLTVLVTFILAISLLGGADAVLAETVCDPAFVFQTGTVITVKPTGVADTTNLQCAFDMAIEVGPGIDVHLLSGVYRTDLIFVNDFHGSFTGSGMNKTVITNLPDIYVTPVDVVLNPPSPENRWPDLISFTDGDYTISDMAFKIKGEQPTLPWTIFGIEPPIRTLSAVILMIGTHANARVTHILVEGEPAPDDLISGYNLINGIVFESHFGSDGISGSYVASDSIFRNMGEGTPVIGLLNGSATIKHNTFENVLAALEGADFTNSNFEFSYNNIDADWFGIDLYNMFRSDASVNTYLIKNNVIKSGLGIALESNFAAGSSCLLLGNNVQNITDLGIYLGPETKNCTVVGGSNKTNVLDLGTDNILVGVNNMGTGVGPTIRHFIR